MDPEELLAEIARREEGRGEPVEANVVSSFVRLIGAIGKRARFGRGEGVFSNSRNLLESGTDFLKEFNDIITGPLQLGSRVAKKGGSIADEQQFRELIGMARQDRVTRLIANMDLNEGDRLIARDPEFLRAFAETLKANQPRTRLDAAERALVRNQELSSEIQSSAARGATSESTDVHTFLQLPREARRRGHRDEVAGRLLSERVNVLRPEIENANIALGNKAAVEVFESLMRRFQTDRIRNIQQVAFPDAGFTELRNARDAASEARRARIERERGVR